MRIGELTNIKGRWVQWDNPHGTGFVKMLVTPKTVSLEKEIARRTVTSTMGKKGRITTKIDHKLALKLLIKGCLQDFEGLENDDGTKFEFSQDGAFALLWHGPSELGEFFEESVGELHAESEEGN